MQTSKNRFLFAVATNSCPETCMINDWKQYGADNFSFEIIEEIKKGELQTDLDFKEDLKILLEIWKDKLSEM